MKIFGLNITTAAKYDQTIAELTKQIVNLEVKIDKLEAKSRDDDEVIEAAFRAFPLVLGQTVYDVALKNAKGRYTRVNPVLEYCTITEVVVDTKNYFGLVERLGRKDVFYTREEAEEHLKSVCK